MVGEATPCTWYFGSSGPRCSTIASAVTSNDKSSNNTNRKSTTRFPMSLRWSSYVAPKPSKEAQKRKTAVLGLKSHFAWRRYNASLCENCQQQSCKAIIGLTIRAEMIDGATPSTKKFGSNWQRCNEIANFRSVFARSENSRNT